LRKIRRKACSVVLLGCGKVSSFSDFAIESDATLEADPGLDGIWIKPDDLLKEQPHFLKKNG
jgi:hypothetical protein